MSSTPPTEALLLSIRDTAKTLACCPKTVWQLTKDGKLPAVHIGTRGVRYSRDDILAFISASKDKGGAASEH